jgi:hypothetical protein
MAAESSAKDAYFKDKGNTERSVAVVAKSEKSATNQNPTASKAT